MKKIMLLPTLVCITSLPSVSMAEDAVSFIGKLSTVGITAEMAYANSNHTELFSNINAYNYTKNTTVNSANYDADIRLLSLLAGIRYYPSAANLYVGAGIGLNNNEIVITPKASNDRYVFNGRTYNASELADIKPRAKYNFMAPMFTVGWQSKKINELGLSYFAEVGVLYNGDTELESDAPCSSLSNRCIQLKEDYEIERGALEDKLDNYSIYPVAGFGVRYTF